MKFWQSVAFTEPRELPAIAAGAEAAGFEGVLLSEHVFVPESFAGLYPYTEDGKPPFSADTPFPDPWVAITAMAARTESLRFATMIVILPLHHPIELAKTVASTAVLSADRVVLGAGAGWMREEFEILGVDFQTRGRRFDESIAVLRKLWAGGMVTHSGEFFRFDRLQMSPAPDRPIPILIGGASPRALRRAAELGDGWLGAGNTAEEADGILRKLMELRRQAGREREPFETVVPLAPFPEVDTLQRLAELGATGTVSFPFIYTLGPDATLPQKLDAMKRFSEEVLRPVQEKLGVPASSTGPTPEGR